MSDAADLTGNTAIKMELENERRNIKDIWNDALRAYKGVLGEDLKPEFPDVDAMIENANKQMLSFNKWRHDGARIDKLRSLFMSNVDYIQTATQNIASAAEPAFPPAAAISTAMTFILSACKSVSADYDVVTAFFDDMNSFLQRVSILEARLPMYKAYQACLMDVFASLLKMCAFAQKFIKLGRLKKWVINALLGDDSDLSSSRKAMDRALNRLESATEFAILANTENLVVGQQVLQSMQRELLQNQQKQMELQRSQEAMVQEMLEGQLEVKDEIGDIKKLLEALQGTSDDQGSSNHVKDPRSDTNAVRTIIDDIPENRLQLLRIKDSHLPGTCRWIFELPVWKSWYTSTDPQNDSPLLIIRGSDGSGKSHMAATIYEQIERDASKDPSDSLCAVYFFCHESVAHLKSFQSIINGVILQLSDTNVVIRNRLNSLLSHDTDGMPEQKYLEELITPLFHPSSQFFLYVVIDAVDALETNWDKDALFHLVREIKQSNLRIKIIATMRPSVQPTDSDEPELMNWLSSNELVITKDVILPDMKAIIQDRLQTTDSAFRGIRYLKTEVKELIASKIEERADKPLYAEQALLYLSNLGREGPIKKLLAHAMPLDIEGWFQTVLDKCERHTPHDMVASLQVLLTWLLFSFNALSINAINRVIQMATERPDFDLEDEIMYTYGAFLQLHSTSTYTYDSARDPNVSAPGAAPADENEDARLIFRKRSMREFFLRRLNVRNSNASVTSSQGHRQLFLLCYKVIEQEAVLQESGEVSDGHRELHQYALKYCLRHWQHICPKLHDTEDNVAIYETFWKLISHKENLPKQIEIAGLDFTIDQLIVLHESEHNVDQDSNFFMRWDDWSKWLKGSDLDPNSVQLRSHMTVPAVEYWTTDHTHALMPLAKAHLRNCFGAKKPIQVYVAYNFARKTVQKTSMKDTLCYQYPSDEFDGFQGGGFLSGDKAEAEALYEEIVRLRDISGLSLESNTHFATAVLAKSAYSNGRHAVCEMERAIEKCDSNVDKFRYLTYMGDVYYWACNSINDGLRCFRSALELRNQVPLADVLEALEQQASILYQEERADDASAVYREIALLDPEHHIIDSLAVSRFIMHMRRAEWPAVMDAFLDSTPIQRLKIALYQFNWRNAPHEGVHPAIFKAAIVAGKVDELLRMYALMIRDLDVSNMGLIWMPLLANVHRSWYADMIAAKAVLTKALETSCTVQTYASAGVDTAFVAVRIVNILSDIVFEQFRNSRDLDTKVGLLTGEASGLLQQRLPQSVQISDASKIPHLLVLANMARKVGPAGEYEKLLRQAFNAAWATLTDSITSNDSDGMWYLSRVVGQVPGFEREAEILSSAMLYYLGDRSFFAAFCDKEGLPVDETAAIDFEKAMTSQQSNETWKQASSSPADHEKMHQLYQKYSSAESGCFTSFFFLFELDFRKWWTIPRPICTRSVFCANLIEFNALSDFRKTWDEGPLYTCLLCTHSVLCQTCYDTRIQWNTTGKPDDEPSFCCSGGKYIKSPTDDWLGIKLQSIYLKGQAPIKFDDFLQQVRARWNEYWDEFWLG